MSSKVLRCELRGGQTPRGAAASATRIDLSTDLICLNIAAPKIIEHGGEYFVLSGAYAQGDAPGESTVLIYEAAEVHRTSAHEPGLEQRVVT